MFSSIYQFADWFRISAIVNDAKMNMGLQSALSYTDFIVFGYIVSSGVAGLCVNFILKFLRNFHTALHNGYMNFHPP